jgi:hypothetical protein
MRILAITVVALFASSTASMAAGHGGGNGHSPSGHGTANVATGMTSGKRQHKPLKVVKEWGAASPMLRGQSNLNDRKGGRYLGQ